METVEVKKSDLNKILNTAEILVDEVEQALSQDELLLSIKRGLEDAAKGRLRER